MRFYDGAGVIPISERSRSFQTPGDVMSGEIIRGMTSCDGAVMGDFNSWKISELLEAEVVSAEIIRKMTSSRGDKKFFLSEIFRLQIFFALRSLHRKFSNE